MKISSLPKYAVGITAAAALVAGCSSVVQSGFSPAGAIQTYSRTGWPDRVAPDSSTLLYVSNNPGGSQPGSVEYFKTKAKRNARPQSVIAGSYADMLATAYIVVDASKTMWVTQESGPYVTGFSAGANGNVAPNFLIAGSNTELSSPTGLGIDSSNNLYVGNCGSICGGTEDNIELFNAGSNGNVPPVEVIKGSSTLLDGVSGVTIDPSGNVWAANRGTDSVTEYAAGQYGNTPPICQIIGLSADPNGIAFDSTSDLYVRDGDFAIAVFAPGSCGDATPARLISGSKTGLDYPDGLFVSGNGTLYVANRKNNSITEYAPGANGNAHPIRTIKRGHTQLDGPVGIYVR